MTAAQDEAKFYGKIGHYFASRAVRKELGGYPMNNEPDWPWLIAIEKQRFEVVGFVCIEPFDDYFMIHDCYVNEDYRGKGIFKTMINKVSHYAKTENKYLRTCAFEKVKPIFEKVGFIATKQNGQWHLMKKEDQHE